MGCSLDDEVKRITYNSPYIAVVCSDSGIQFIVVAEQLVAVESKSMLGAIKDLIAVYFVSSIEYLKALMATYTFAQHYILNLKDDQTVANVVVQISEYPSKCLGICVTV